MSGGALVGEGTDGGGGGDGSGKTVGGDAEALIEGDFDPQT